MEQPRTYASAITEGEPGLSGADIFPDQEWTATTEADPVEPTAENEEQ